MKTFKLFSETRQRYIAQQQADKQLLKEEAIQRQFDYHFNKIATDTDEYRNLHSREYWLNFAGEGMTISSNSSQLYNNFNNNPLLEEDECIKSRTLLNNRGFLALSDDKFDWSKDDINFVSIATAMDQLSTAGWPPVFVFLFDQPWKICLRLFDLMPQLLDDPESVLESSMFAWSLHKPPITTDPLSPSEKVGANFGSPHRDISYKNCHHPVNGLPDILSLWIPVVDVTTDSGCMFVIPRECDPQFAKDTTQRDQDPFAHKFPYQHATPLAPLSAGSVLVWHPNLIHWGSACSPYSSVPPRKSIAMAFRVRDETRPSTEKELERYGRKPYSRDELIAGVPSFETRLRIIVKMLKLYNVWYPQYDGFDIDKLR